MLRRFAIISFVIYLAPQPVAAEDLVPPKPGLTVKFRITSTANQPVHEQTFTVTSVDGLEAVADGTRTGQPTFKGALRLYRIWYARQSSDPDGVHFQDSPTSIIDEFATLRVGMIRIFPARLRYEAAPDRPSFPDGQLNESWSEDVTMTYQVERRETVKVPAGSFDTFVLKRTEEFTDGAGNVTRRKYTRTWFAPELRWWVRIEIKSELPDGPPSFAEAVEIRRR